MWLERFIIVIQSLHHDFLPSAWELYVPTIWDWATFIGTIGLFLTLFLLFCRYLPVIAASEMRELVHQQHENGGGHDHSLAAIRVGLWHRRGVSPGPEALVAAAGACCFRRLSRVEAYSPFIVEGVAETLGGAPQRTVALITLICGMLGGLTGFGMCWYANVISFPLNIGGRPHNSWPAWIPITFELTVLFAALSAAIGMLMLNGLPRLHHPMFDVPGFDRASTDRFFLCIEARSDSTSMLSPPCWPLSARHIGGARMKTSTKPSQHADITSMFRGFMFCVSCFLSPRLQPRRHGRPGARQAAAPQSLFRRRRRARAAPPAHRAHRRTRSKTTPPPGKIATTATRFPFPITRNDLLRGQQQFNIYCTPCHGILGDGDGMIPERGFTRPPSYHTDRLRNAPPTYFYNVITLGIGAMFPYADRVKPEDRWRVAAYIRALQFSQNAAPCRLDRPRRRPHEPRRVPA